MVATALCLSLERLHFTWHTHIWRRLLQCDRLRLLDGATLRLSGGPLACVLILAFFLFTIVRVLCTLLSELAKFHLLALVLFAELRVARLGLQPIVVDDRLPSESPLVRLLKLLDDKDGLVRQRLLHEWHLVTVLLRRSPTPLAARLLVLRILDEHLVTFLLDLVEELLRMAPDLG